MADNDRLECGLLAVLAPDLQALVDGLEQAPDGVALCRDLDLDAGVGGIAVDDRVRLASFGVDVLSDIAGVGVAAVAEGAALQVDAERVVATGAVGGVGGEGLHDIALVVARGAADGVGAEVDDAAGHLGGWGAGGGYVGWVWDVDGRWVVVVGCCVNGRQFDCLLMKWWWWWIGRTANWGLVG